MRARLGLIAAAAVIAACTPVPEGADWDVDPVCDANTAPEIGNLVLNSAFFPAQLAWGMCVGFDWIDPGRDEAGTVGTDPPNMLGGFYSSEFTGVETVSIWFDDAAVDPAAASGSLEVSMHGEGLTLELDAIAQWLPSEGFTPDWSACPDLNENGTTDITDCLGGVELSFALRVRDNCDAPSNPITGRYMLGTDRRVESEGLTGCQEVQAPAE